MILNLCTFLVGTLVTELLSIEQGCIKTYFNQIKRAVAEKLCLLQGLEGKVPAGAAAVQEGEGHAHVLSLRQPRLQVPQPPNLDE